MFKNGRVHLALRTGQGIRNKPGDTSLIRWIAVEGLERNCVQPCSQWTSHDVELASSTDIIWRKSSLTDKPWRHSLHSPQLIASILPTHTLALQPRKLGLPDYKLHASYKLGTRWEGIPRKTMVSSLLHRMLELSLQQMSLLGSGHTNTCLSCKRCSFGWVKGGCSSFNRGLYGCWRDRLVWGTALKMRQVTFLTEKLGQPLDNPQTGDTKARGCKWAFISL